jgi:5'-deoxynucleotidase YfbR-like HD superfamily hydrolase
MSDDRAADIEASGAAAFLFELGTLKHVKRTGWWAAGIKDPETVAEHSHRATILASMLAAMEGADPARAGMLAALHDTQETRIGDVSHIARRYLTVSPNDDITVDQVAGCPPSVAIMVRAAVGEYERQETPEAIIAKDADKLECLLQAVEYQRQGYTNTQPWIDSSRAALKTASAQRIADAAVTMTGLEWRQL